MGRSQSRVIVAVLVFLVSIAALQAQMIDNTQATNTAAAGINKSLIDEIGAGRGSVLTPGSSLYIINRDPFRSIRRGRQLFQRKFTQAQGQGPNEGDGVGDLNTDIAIGAGLGRQLRDLPFAPARVGGYRRQRPDTARQPRLFRIYLDWVIKGNAGR